MLSEPMFQKFLSLTCQLSPENLHCDGEISLAEAERNRRRLMKAWRALEVEVGRPVTEDEIWAQERQSHTPTPYEWETPMV
jgi:hypothetical protein